MLVVIIIAIAVVALLVVGLIARPRRSGPSHWREERHVSDDGRHVVEETEFD